MPADRPGVRLTPVVLVGPTIALRPLRLDDCDELCAIGLDPAIWRHTTLKVRSRDEMKEYIASALAAAAAGTALPFVITLARTGEAVGTTRYHSFSPSHARIEIGFTWLTRHWQRTQVNTESKYLLLHHAFEQLACQRVQFISAADNEPSKRALARIGARFEGILRAYFLGSNDESRDAAIFSITSADWIHLKEEQRCEARRLHSRTTATTTPTSS
jgi:RimJ/RimL family protein N-acetyltransferase